MSDWHAITLFIHILAGVTWVGAGFLVQGHAESVLRSEGLVAADKMLQQFAWTKWLFVPMLLAGGVGGAYEKKLDAHRETGTVASPEFGRLFRSFLRVNAIEMERSW